LIETTNHERVFNMKFTLQQRWMQRFEDKVCELAPQHRGKIEWQTATFFFNEGRDAIEAAKQYVETRKC
jgi:acetylornithine/succinyldiaminopimelate/putrescine aminotransferase